MNYKETLLMPQTDFPMRGNLPNKEPEMQTDWDAQDVYEQSLERAKGKPSFILHDGPPYANGDIHIGHAENKVLKDMIVRFKAMSGYYAPYVPGWDTHGLPIEQALTKKGVNRKKLSVAEFRKLCAEYALEQVERQKMQFKRLGVRGDWDNPYITLKKEYEAEQIKLFGEMVGKGYIYKDKKTIYWSPSSESALAEAEIEYQDKRSPSIYVSFKVKDGKNILNKDEEIVIWTTTPWTIPANVAISVNANYNYSVVKAGDRKVVVASDLLEKLKAELDWQDAEILRTVKGKDLEYVTCQHPFYDRESLVILGDHVTLDAGTGCVHTAPGHGEDDFYVAKKYGLDVLCPVDEKGVFTEEAQGFEGLFYDKANKPITEKLEEVGALVKLEFFTHSYPHDWRTKKPVIFRATKQWFASIKDFRKELLEAVANTKWQPKWGETRLFNMVRDREDWCISRQRIWGVPIPAFYGEDGEPIMTDETIANVVQLFKEHGSNIWFEWDAKDLLPSGFTSPHSPNGQFTKETDIMDVWFDSGSSHQSVLEARDNLSRPADVYLEGSDQYRGWFNSSLSTSVAVSGKAPYKQVISHGFTLDGEGKKMSKSIGNVIDPIKVMKQLGADIIRLWVSSVDYTADARVSEDILKQVAEVYRKVRNTLRFMLGNLKDFKPEHKVEIKDMPELDQFMMVKLNQVIKKVVKAYNEYQFLTVYNTIHNFCTVELSSFYMDIAKDALYTEPENSMKRRSIQTVLFETLNALTKLLSPIIPHTAEEVWKYSPHFEGKEAYVQLSDMPIASDVKNSAGIEEKWTALMAVRDDVLKALEKARSEKVIGKSLEAAVTLYPKAEHVELLMGMKELDKLFIVSKVTVKTGDETEKDAVMYHETAVAVTPAEGEKCERCWVVSETVGNAPEHPALCEDCAETVIKHYS